MQSGVCCCMGTPGLVRAAVARGWAEHGSRAPAGPSQGNGGAPAWRSDRVNWSGLWCGYTWAGQFGCACDEQGSGKPRAGGACRSNGHCVGVGAVHQPVQARGSEVHLRWSSIVGGRESDGATGKRVGDSCVQRARPGAAGSCWRWQSMQQRDRQSLSRWRGECLYRGQKVQVMKRNNAVYGPSLIL